MADALHYAHKQGLVHRDVKPGNILIGSDGKPYVVDFGLALREENIGKGPKYAGTPAYMSPEQARGEGHRVDGRSDIFSLGVVFYELLAGRRPFQGDTQQELLEQITSFEPRPPRQYRRRNPEGTGTHLPQRLSQTSVGAIHDGQRTWPKTCDIFWPKRTGGGSRNATASICLGASSNQSTIHLPLPLTAATPASDSQPIKIVPKGLRSFDAHDADFFLELLPGPRDREGLARQPAVLEDSHRGDRCRQDVLGGPDLRAIRMRQVIAGQGGAVAPAFGKT